VLRMTIQTQIASSEKTEAAIVPRKVFLLVKARQGRSYSTIFAMCTGKSVLGKSEVSSKALKPSPVTSV